MAARPVDGQLLNHFALTEPKMDSLMVLRNSVVTAALLAQLRFAAGTQQNFCADRFWIGSPALQVKLYPVICISRVSKELQWPIR